jgi:addiction module HigA family antidote
MRNRMGPIHPGTILRDEFLLPGALLISELARPMGLAAVYLREIVAGRKPITADVADRLSRCLGTTARFWITLQASYDEQLRRR